MLGIPLRRTVVPIERSLGLFQIYRLFSTSFLFVPVLLLFFGERGLSITQITLLNTVYSGTLILFEVPTGVLADRWGRKRAMVLGSLLTALGCLFDFVGHSFVVFAIGEGLLALGMTLCSGADSAYLYDLLRSARREREYGRWEGRASAAKLVGAAMALAAGGWLARKSLAATYLVSALVCLAASVMAAFLREPPPLRRRARHGLVMQMVTSARQVATQAPLRFAVAFSTLVFTLVRMSLYLYQPYLTDAGFDVTAVGLVFAALSLVGAWAAHRVETLRRLLGERGLVWALPLLLALSYFFLGSWVTPWGIALLFLQSTLNGVYSPLSKELINREIFDSSERATVLSVESMTRRLGFGLFAPLCGAAIQRNGLGAGLHACAALGVCGAVALAPWLLRYFSEAERAIEHDSDCIPIPLPQLETSRLEVTSFK